MKKREKTTTTTAHLPSRVHKSTDQFLLSQCVYTDTPIRTFPLPVCLFVCLFVIAHQMCARISVNIENGRKQFQTTGHRKWVWFWNIIRFTIGLDKWPTDHRIRRWQNLNIQFQSNVLRYLFTFICNKHLFAFFRKSFCCSKYVWTET